MKTADTIDYWANSFLPNREALWNAALEAQGIPIKIRSDPADSFADPEAMITRMDELGISTLILPTCDLPDRTGPYDFEPIAMQPEETEQLAKSFPHRFVAEWSIDPNSGMAGVERAREMAAHPWVVALHLHTHSFDRPFDSPDYYPYYALASELGLPFVMQAGTSGGRLPSACGQPIGIDRPAIYFPAVDFILSHTGWPWVEEAVAMALKFSNVYLGTASFPPRRWNQSLKDFIRGPGRRKALFGTSFPTVGHRHALGQLGELQLSEEATANLLGANARRIFKRLDSTT
ncbi:MAG: amidohydrolase family protein [Deltaproteobacteria bacterium]|nr:amidohydrolase family protein [Deltaproteobacteria bacterium]MBW2359965.1 amidohydrolase family protein [Deltaproteobacteria bacterium]